MRNTLHEIDSRMEKAEDQISDLKDKVMESNQAEQKRQKRMMQNENRLRELGDPIKCNNSHVIGEVPEKEREGCQEIYLKQ